MSQNKCILDATAGFRMMWFDKEHPNTLYIDERPECKPDICCSWKDLSKFVSGKKTTEK